MKGTKRLAVLAMFTAIALTIFVAEAQIPPVVPIPGVKLKFRDANKQSIWDARTMLVNAGQRAAQLRQNEDVLKYWGAFLDTEDSPLFTGISRDSQKAYFGQVALFTSEYADMLKNHELANKYIDLALKKIHEYLEVLESNGTRAGVPYVKRLDDKIYELRPLADRILFAAWVGNRFILLHHFVKKTQKTPPREIEQARRNLKAFLEREDSDEE